VLVADLTAENLDDRVARGIEDLEVGLLAYNAGAVHGAKHFLDQSVEHAMTLVRLNCRGTVLLTHRLAGPMRERGRGGILLMTSLTAVNHPGIAGMVHTQRNDLAHPRPIRLGKDPRDLDPARLEVDDEENKNRTKPERVIISTLKKSVAAITPQCAFKKVFHEIPFFRVGSNPLSRRIRLIVFRPISCPTL
jgi:NAD(P)-dependent dehydrogenase (short-subunit alcohol dehydrogenase family)